MSKPVPANKQLYEKVKQEAKSKFVTSLEALLLKANKKKLSKNMPFKNTTHIFGI